MSALPEHWTKLPQDEQSWLRCQTDYAQALKSSKHYLAALKLLFVELKSEYWRKYKVYPKGVQDLHDILECIIAKGEDDAKAD